MKQRLRHLIVIIPGIGGSVLQRAGEKKPVWGDGLPRVAARALDPEKLSWSPGDGLRAVGLIRSASIVPGWTVLHGYGELVRGICNRFQGVLLDEGHPDHRIPGANVVLFPYDFRQSITVAAERLAAEMKLRLNGWGERDQHRRVVVVAHSMGGLVARWWLGPLGGWRCCRALVTLGTPHRGAPKALDWLVNGVRLKGVRLPAATEVIRGWPSVYELLPRYPAVIHRKTSTTCYPYELGINGLDQQARVAFELHKKIEEDWDEVAAERDGPQVTPFLGCGHPTLDRASWAGALSVTKDCAEWSGQPEGWFGDGTVPALAAGPIEQDERRAGWRRPPVRHGALPSYPGVVGLLETINAEAKTPMRGPEEEGPSLGVDVEEWYPAGDPVPVEVFLRQVPQGQDVRGVRVWASVLPEGGGTPDRIKLEHAGDRWVSELGGLAPGSYRLTVEARRVPGGTPPPVEEVFGVVDPSVVEA